MSMYLKRKLKQLKSLKRDIGLHSYCKSVSMVLFAFLTDIWTALHVFCHGVLLFSQVQF